MRLPIILTIASVAFGTTDTRNKSSPCVEISNGTIIGSTDNDVDTFNAIPFASSPVGSLRLKPPQPLSTGFGTLIATAIPTSCPQPPSKSSAANSSAPTGEDCLTLNVQRPSKVSPWEKLPVLIWIYGGGFTQGSTQEQDATPIVQKSVALGKPLLYVQMNYRVSGFGFLAGKELQQDGSTNLGLRDQRAALHWVNENIAAFGGDPDRVTIWGESAGAISTFDHTIIDGGSGTNLFRAAIMNSGSLTPTTNVSSTVAQKNYDNVVRSAGCSNATSTLDCLRNVPYSIFYNATMSGSGYTPRPDSASTFYNQQPTVSMQQGKFARVPVIIGDQLDEGTNFVLGLNINTTGELTSFLMELFPVANASQIDALVASYPDDPAAGSPFNTGSLYNSYPQQKRLAAIAGDFFFTLARRLYLNLLQESVPAWSYMATYTPETPIPSEGVYHGSDLLSIYETATANAIVTDSILTYYIAFVNELDPNAFGTDKPLIEWPQWYDGAKLLNFDTSENRIIKDDFRSASYDVLAANFNSY